MANNIPPVQPNAFRVVIDLQYPESRLDKVLLQALQKQNENEKLKNISRGGLKELFAKGKILIKGQNSRPSSSLAKGVTYIDILD